jgi:single-strand DNA-binding protein
MSFPITTTHVMNETVAALLRSAAWTIPGNLGSDPEVRFLNSGTSVCSFSLAVNKPGAKKGDGQQPDWFKVEIWGDDAQAAADTLHKGSRCIVTGRVRTERWIGKDGHERTSTVIRADEWRCPDATPAQPAAAATARPAAPAAAAWQVADDGAIDAEIPF